MERSITRNSDQLDSKFVAKVAPYRKKTKIDGRLNCNRIRKMISQMHQSFKDGNYVTAYLIIKIK